MPQASPERLRDPRLILSSTDPDGTIRLILETRRIDVARSFPAGWLPSSFEAKVDLTEHLLTQDHSMGSLLGAVNYWGRITNWGMMQNDKWGCCVFACQGHIAVQQTAYGLGHAVDVTDAEVLAAYHAVAGFSINAGPPGSNPTDKGSTCAAGLSYLKKHGLAGFEIQAFGHVDPKKHDAVKRAVEDFGALCIGMLVSKAALYQNGNNMPWVLVDDDGGIDGGHCVMVVGYDTQWVYVVTWGHVQRMSWDFWDKYVDESWALISRDWTSVTGLDLQAFGAEFAAIFACRNPFIPTVAQEVEAAAVKWYHKLLPARGAHAR